MYIEMLMILKRYIHAERAGVWDEHLVEVENRLPYLVSAGHYKYVSCVPHYLKAMKELPVTASFVAEEFQRGHFNVHRNPGKFNGVWTDMALEQTQLFHGITQQPDATGKYLRALLMLTAVSEQTKLMAHMDSSPLARNGREKSNRDGPKDAQKVMKIKELIQTKMINPFSSDLTDLINISTGQKANSLDLLDVIGEQQHIG